MFLRHDAAIRCVLPHTWLMVVHMAASGESSPDRSDHDGSVEPTRVSISLTGPILDVVRELAQRNGITEGEVTRRAIRLMKDITEDVDRGAVFRVQAPGGESERIRFVGLFGS